MTAEKYEIFMADSVIICFCIGGWAAVPCHSSSSKNQDQLNDSNVDRVPASAMNFVPQESQLSDSDSDGLDLDLNEDEQLTDSADSQLIDDNTQQLSEPIHLSQQSSNSLNTITTDSVIPEKPHHPMLSAFPQRIIGKQKRSFCSTWYRKYQWLHYQEHDDSVLCFYCHIPEKRHLPPTRIVPLQRLVFQTGRKL